MRIKLNVGTTVSRPLPTGKTIYLKVRNITLISDDSMPFVHVEFDRWTTSESVDKVTAVFGEVVQWLNSYSDWRIEESVSFTCPDCRSVTVDMADVKALEADNKRLKKELDDLKFLLDTNIRLGIKADEFIVEQAAEIKQLEIMLTQRTDGNRELIEALKALKAVKAERA